MFPAGTKKREAPPSNRKCSPTIKTHTRLDFYYSKHHLNHVSVTYIRSCYISKNKFFTLCQVQSNEEMFEYQSPQRPLRDQSPELVDKRHNHQDKNPSVLTGFRARISKFLSINQKICSQRIHYFEKRCKFAIQVKVSGQESRLE